MSDSKTTNSESTAARRHSDAKKTKVHHHAKTRHHHQESIEEFLKSVFQLTLDEVVRKGRDRSEPVIRFKKPEELLKLLDLEIRDEPLTHSDILEHCSKVIKYSVKTGHPRFYNQLYAGLDTYGFIGQILTDALNTSVTLCISSGVPSPATAASFHANIKLLMKGLYTYEVAPVFVLMEQVLLKRFRDVVGYKDGDGTFSPGGAYSNMLGMNLARHFKIPDVKSKGMCNCPRMVAFASEHSHYSAKKNASLLGIGADNVIMVKCDERGKMDPEDLERRVVEAISEDAVAFLVVATAGTTVLGSFDPLDAIADVCDKYKIWLHVDAAWGGASLLSTNQKHLCWGINRSDSVTWNPHKMMMAPLQCCVFVTKHPNSLEDCHSLPVPYLFQQDKRHYAPEYDVGTKVVQCGRKVDSLKLWLMWKGHGNDGLRSRIDKAFENAAYLAGQLREKKSFKLVSEPEFTNVCFWYIPKSMRATEWNLADAELHHKLSQVAPTIKERMVKTGSMLIGYQPLGDLPNFFRMVVINDDVTHEDMDFVIDEIDKLGCDL